MRKAVIGLVAFLSVACMNGDISGSSTVNGTYTLRTVNGSPLPFTDFTTSNHKTIFDDALTLNEGGAYTETSHVQTTENAQVTTHTIVDSGSYALIGNSISFTSSTGGSRVATGKANSLTFIEAGMTLVYSK